MNILQNRSAAFGLIALLSLAAPLYSAPIQVGSGVTVWNSGPGHNGNSYEVFRVAGGILWYDAEARAIALGGHLVSIHSLDEDNFVASLISNPANWLNVSGYERGPWIGAQLINGNWTWSDGTPFDYTNWYPGQPDNYGGVENSIQFYGDTISNTWNDISASFNYPIPPGTPEPDSYVVEWAAPTAVRAGAYTILLSATDTSASVPQGMGYATMIVGRERGVLMNGRLPDGQRFDLVGGISNEEGIYSFEVDHVVAYPDVSSQGSLGFLFGTLNFAQLSGTSDLNGTLTWIKPRQKAGAYPAAIDTNLNVIGSIYIPANAHGTVLPGFTNGTLNLDDPGGSILSAPVQLEPPNRLVITPPADNLNVAIDPLTGFFKGTFLYPGQTAPTAFAGVLFQDQASGAGFFLGPGGSGTVTLSPTP